jgi:hypothetical protein
MDIRMQRPRVFFSGKISCLTQKKTPDSAGPPGVFGIRFRESDYAFE